MINFDEMFDEYMTEYFTARKSEFKSVEAMEEYVPELYTKWCDTENEDLGGKKPSEYFASLPFGELYTALTEYVDEGIEIPEPLMEALHKLGEERELYAALTETSNPELKLQLARLLFEMKSKLPLSDYVDMLAAESEPKDLEEYLADVLSEFPNDVKENILKVYNSVSEEKEALFLDVLVNTDYDERVYRLLTEKFLLGVDTALYASYLGKYGNSEAVELLKKYALEHEINYAEYSEIRFAIESLGGEFDIDESKFANDPYFKKIKGARKSEN